MCDECGYVSKQCIMCNYKQSAIIGNAVIQTACDCCEGVIMNSVAAFWLARSPGSGQAQLAISARENTVRPGNNS